MGPKTRHHPLPHITNVTIGQREEIISRSAAKSGTHSSRKFRDRDSSSPRLEPNINRWIRSKVRPRSLGSVIDTPKPR